MIWGYAAALYCVGSAMRVYGVVVLCGYARAMCCLVNAKEMHYGYVQCGDVIDCI